MSKKSFLTLALVSVLALILVVGPAAAQDKVTITWYCCLGTGGNPDQLDAENKAVADFNAMQDKINLVITIVNNTGTASQDALSTMIGAGNGPDIVGPVGVDGSNIFAGSWLDLQPLVDKTNYDLSVFPQGLVDIYRGPDGLLGIPLASFPSFIYYNQDLFDEADIAYPPAAYGDKYTMPDGTEVDWTWDTLAQVAKLLTVDANGNDANSADFDPDSIEQFGYIWQWDAIRDWFTTFGGGYPVVNADGKVILPDSWRAASEWTWNGLWNDHFIPNATYQASTALTGGGGAFSSGHVAMAKTHLWYTCCLGDLKSKWNMGALPSDGNGNIYSTIDADTFRVYKATPHPDEAFTVLTYLLGEASLPLETVYGGLPALVGNQQAYIDTVTTTFNNPDLNMAIVVDSANYAAAPHHESDFPNYAKGKARFNDFQTLLLGDTGADMDLNAELDKLQSDLQAIVDEKK